MKIKKLPAAIFTAGLALLAYSIALKFDVLPNSIIPSSLRRSPASSEEIRHSHDDSTDPAQSKMDQQEKSKYITKQSPQEAHQSAGETELSAESTLGTPSQKRPANWTGSNRSDDSAKRASLNPEAEKFAATKLAMYSHYFQVAALPEATAQKVYQILNDEAIQSWNLRGGSISADSALGDAKLQTESQLAAVLTSDEYQSLKEYRSTLYDRQSAIQVASLGTAQGVVFSDSTIDTITTVFKSSGVLYLPNGAAMLTDSNYSIMVQYDLTAQNILEATLTPAQLNVLKQYFAARHSK